MKKPIQSSTRPFGAWSLRALRRSGCGPRILAMRCFTLVLGIALAGMSSRARAEDWAFLMDSDPVLTPELKERAVLAPMAKMWRTALQHAEDREWIATTSADIIKAARSGTDRAAMLEILQPAIRAAFERETRSAVRLNLANAILAIEDYGLSQEFVALGRKDVGFAASIFPQLAAAGQLDAAEWRDMLDRKNSVRRRRLAIQCATIGNDLTMFDPLSQLAMDRRERLILRMEAAAAVAQLSGDHDDLLSAGQQLIEDEGPIGEMLAARLLASAKQEASAQLLKKLTLSPNLGASAIACGRLKDRWPDVLVRIADQMPTHPSAQSRLLTTQCVSDHAGRRAPKLLGAFMADVHPTVREAAGAGLVMLARGDDHSAGPPPPSPMLDAVIAEVRRATAESAWQGHAQAARVADEIYDVAASEGMLKLFEAEERRSCEAAAYFLGRHLPVDQAGELLARFRHLVENQSPDNDYIIEMMLLLQGIGRTKHEPAIPDLERYVPKNPNYYPPLRAAAIWAIGKTYEGEAPEKWSKAFAARVEDVDGMIPEYDAVRTASAIALGRMNSQEQISSLRRFSPSRESRFGKALGWAMERLTGETTVYPEIRRPVKSDFFTMPIFTSEQMRTFSELANPMADAPADKRTAEGKRSASEPSDSPPRKKSPSEDDAPLRDRSSAPTKAR